MADPFPDGGRPAPREVPGATEDDIQRAIMRFLEAVTDPDQVIAFHIPNGGARSKPEAAIMKGLGVLAGAADIFIGWKPAPPDPGAAWVKESARRLEDEYASDIGPHPGLGFLEVKTDTGRPSPAQKEFRRRCDAMQIEYRIVRSVDDVDAVIQEWGVPNRRRKDAPQPTDTR